jgi:hypothetical protein
MPEYIERTERSRRLHERLREVMPGGDTRTITWFPRIRR